MQNRPIYFENERKTFRDYDPNSPEDVKKKFESSIQQTSMPLFSEVEMQKTYENQPPTSSDIFNLQLRMRESQIEQDRQLKMDQIINKDLYEYAKDKENEA